MFTKRASTKLAVDMFRSYHIGSVSVEQLCAYKETIFYHIYIKLAYSIAGK